MQIDLTTNPTITLCRTFDVIAHSSHLNLTKVGCFALTTTQEQFEELPFGCLAIADNYVGTDFFTADGALNEGNLEPEDISLEYVSKLQSNILLFYKFAVDISYNKNVDQVVIAYDAEYAAVAAAFATGYYILKNEDPEEAVALIAVRNPSVYFDYPTVCFLDLTLECNQKLIEAVETYEVMEVAVTRTGLVAERLA